jgi:hypothetical protein
MDACIRAEFGMEGRGEQIVLADQDREAVADGQGLYLGAGARDARGADEDHFERAAGEFGRHGEDAGVDLASVGVAFDGDVEDAEGFLWGMLNVFGEQDGSGAGAEGGGVEDEGGKGIEESVALKEFEHGGGFAAGDDETIYRGVAIGRWITFGLDMGFRVVQVCRGADEPGGGVEGLEDAGMRLVGSLKGEDAYGERSTVFRRLLRHVTPPSPAKVVQSLRIMRLMRGLTAASCVRGRIESCSASRCR